MPILQKTRDRIGVESPLKTLAAVLLGITAWYFESQMSVFEIRGVLPVFAVIAGVMIISVLLIDTDGLDSDLTHSLRLKTKTCLVVMGYLIFLNFITITSTAAHVSAFVSVSLFVFFSVSSLSDILDAAV